MNILDEIITHKMAEVKVRKELYPIKLLEQSVYFDAEPVSLKKYLKREDKVGVIAEIKRKSPSKGSFNSHFSVEELSIGYMQAGASAISVLTDEKYFGGSNEDLMTARKFNFCPILRKDFIVDEYQIYEAKSIGADAILLIARVLSPQEINSFTATAHKLKMEVALEVHNEQELDKALSDQLDIVGVNNRDLDTFEVSYEHSLALAPKIPDQFVKVSESGIDEANIITLLKQAGFKGFLVGEAFMKTSRPQRACGKLINAVREAC
ncbi:indole-3-glycerol phosphate synthase TrpC [Oligoflexia bacterium]|nr:indole-3-glycerol phosphate synthase TrpC [Oligoflexia bacterium]